MSDWNDLHVAAPVAANLTALGWSASHPRIREATPITARGHNVVVLAPPAPAWSGPALAGALSHLASTPAGRLLLVTPPDAVAEWSAHLAALTAGTALRTLAARSAGRATRVLRSDPPEVLILSHDVAGALVARGDLKIPSLTAIVLAWPEQWAEDPVLLPLMQDLPTEAQRIIIGSSPDRATELAERYARRAPVVGPPAGSGTVGPVRTVATSWARRAASIADLVELLDPADLTVWSVDTRLHDEVRSGLRGVAPAVRCVTEVPEAPAGLIVALDLPDTATLTALVAAGDVVLFVPPGCEAWISGAAAPRRPLLLPGVIDEAAEEVRRRRAAISRAVEEHEGTLEASQVLGPLFERHEAPAVAAALYALWVRRMPEATAPAVTVADGALEKLWIGIGRRDEVGVSELVAYLTREVGLDRAMIGRIEVRETFCLVEVPRAEAPRIAEALSGRTMRRRRLVARIDRGAPAPGGRPPRGRAPA